MGTENPKVSAYVPQAIKDRLKQFREEHALSESQAVTVILAEYFGMTQVLGRSPEGLTAEGVTLPRMKALEEKVTNLTEAMESRFQKLEEMIVATRKMSSLPVVYPEVLETEAVINDSSINLLTTPSEELLEDNTSKHDGGLDSEPPEEQGTDTQESSLLSEPQIELPIQAGTQQVGEASGVEEGIKFSSGQEISEAIDASRTASSLAVNHPEAASSEISVSGVGSSSSSKLQEDNQDAVSHHQSELPFELHSEPPIEFTPVNSVKLSRRFNKGDQSVKHMKRNFKNDVEGFVKHTQEKDPDKIAWKYTSKGYVPIGELTNEQKSSLLKWYEKNL